jgi:hypothetical protein
MDDEVLLVARGLSYAVYLKSTTAALRWLAMMLKGSKFNFALLIHLRPQTLESLAMTVILSSAYPTLAKVVAIMTQYLVTSTGRYYQNVSNW